MKETLLCLGVARSATSLVFRESFSATRLAGIALTVCGLALLTR
jgi:multidrug transporter EmrE-like cation transporter